MSSINKNTATLLPLHYEPVIHHALMEDMPYGGDITTAVCGLKPNMQLSASLRAREHGVLCGIDIAIYAFQYLDKSMKIDIFKHDGDNVSKGDILMRVKGSVTAILQAERTALNILSHLSGIATMTHAYCDRVRHTNARIAGTRKTLPGLRHMQKYAVQCGGGLPHRYGLNDAIMIKDNHIEGVGSIELALTAAHENKPHTATIQIEVDTLEQLKTVLDIGHADIILLDNMSVENLSEAVKMVNDDAITEASGGINLDTVAEIAETGVDIISVGALTHSVIAMDIGLDMNMSMAV